MERARDSSKDESRASDYNLTAPQREKAKKLIESDLKNIALEVLLKIWIAQLMENALEAKSENIQIRFYSQARKNNKLKKNVSNGKIFYLKIKKG